jgi:hypothetical protein
MAETLRKQQETAPAKQARWIKLEGQEQGDPKHGTMGVYELEEGKEVNGRGVWKAIGRENFMYYDAQRHWISGEVGEVTGFMEVASAALTPDRITETWQVQDGKTWVDAPKVRVRVGTAGAARAEAERRERQRQRAMAQAKQAKWIKLEGQEQGDPKHVLMGVYELEKGKEVNGRGVWKAIGRENFTYYATAAPTSGTSVVAGRTWWRGRVQGP